MEVLGKCPIISAEAVLNFRHAARSLCENDWMARGKMEVSIVSARGDMCSGSAGSPANDRAARRTGA